MAVRETSIGLDVVGVVIRIGLLMVAIWLAAFAVTAAFGLWAIWYAVSSYVAKIREVRSAEQNALEHHPPQVYQRSDPEPQAAHIDTLPPTPPSPKWGVEEAGRKERPSFVWQAFVAALLCSAGGIWALLIPGTAGRWGIAVVIAGGIFALSAGASKKEPSTFTIWVLLGIIVYTVMSFIILIVTR